MQNFTNLREVGTEQPNAVGRTDRRTEMINPKVTFRNTANVPNMVLRNNELF